MGQDIATNIGREGGERRLLAHNWDRIRKQWGFNWGLKKLGEV